MGFLWSNGDTVMAFLRDNCVCEEKLPFPVNALDYSSELNLFAVLEEQTVFVWNPQTKNTAARFDVGWDGVADVLFLPGNYIAVPGGEANHGSDISIFSLNEKEAVLVIEEDDMGIQYPGSIALTPSKNLLVAGGINPCVLEIQLDLQNRKVLGSKDIRTFDDDYELGIETICCSKNYTVCFSIVDDNSFSCVDVEFSADGEVRLTNKQTISYCVINGEERSFGEVRGLAHDGEHVIVATDQDIVVLESAREGSPAHVIVSSGLPCLSSDYGQIRLNNKDQLMMCDGGNFIRVYDYKRPNCLQGLCRYQINKSLEQHGMKNANVEHLPIPQSLKDYLLYKV